MVNQTYESFVYLWYDSINRMFYLGKHKGNPNDSYTHSSTVWESFKKDNIPKGVTRRILAYGTDKEMCLLEHNLLKNRKAKCWERYYNNSLGDPRYVDMSGENGPMYGKTHTQRVRNIISKSQTGDGNSQHGTMWITNGTEDKKIKDGIIPKGWNKGRRPDSRYSKPSSTKGKPGRKHTEEQKQHLRKKSIEAADRKGRVSDDHKKARNKANVATWSARKCNAIIESSDLELIKRIYMNCPKGYQVRAKVKYSAGGKFHQDNLYYKKNIVLNWKDYIRR